MFVIGLRNLQTLQVPTCNVEYISHGEEPSIALFSSCCGFWLICIGLQGPLGFVHLGFEWPWGSYYATHVTHHCCIFLFSITQCSSYFLSPQNYCMCRLYPTLLLQTWMQILVLYERSYMHAIKGKLCKTKAYNKPASTGYKYVHIPSSQLRNITRACISLIMHKASSRHWLFPPPQGLPTLPSLPIPSET